MSDGFSREDFARIAAKITPFAVKAKAQMIRANALRARKTCPECGGTIHLIIAGPRHHLHMACETVGCFMRMME